MPISSRPASSTPSTSSSVSQASPSISSSGVTVPSAAGPSNASLGVYGHISNPSSASPVVPSSANATADSVNASNMAMATALYLSNAENIHRQQLDRRYQSIRRSITGRGARDFGNVTTSLYGPICPVPPSGAIGNVYGLPFRNCLLIRLFADVVDSPSHSGYGQEAQRHSYYGPPQPPIASPPPPPLPTAAPIASPRTSSTEHLASIASSSSSGHSSSALLVPPAPSTQSASAAPQTGAAQVTRDRLLDLPAVRFLLRPDFFNLLHLNDEALAQYNGSPQLKSMVTRVRRECQQNPPVTSSFDRHQHNRCLVSLLNKFAETNKPLPQGKCSVLLCLPF